jgi:DNA-binding SARP family transcriptional activator
VTLSTTDRIRQAPDSVYSVALLGPVCLLEPRGLVPVRGGKQQLLLILLTLSAGRTVSSDRLIDALWGDAPPATADTALRVHVGRLRAQLAKAAPPAPRITHGAGGYTLVLDPRHVDAATFTELIATAGGAPARQARAQLESALALWRGEPFGGLRDPDLVRIEAERLRELHETALEDRAEALLQLGEPQVAVAELEALVRRQPLRERDDGSTWTRRSTPTVSPRTKLQIPTIGAPSPPTWPAPWPTASGSTAGPMTSTPRSR